MNLLAESRLTDKEQQRKVEDIIDRPDDTQRQLWCLRHLATEMLRDPFGWAAISGIVGAGKSLFLAATVASFCRNNRQARYYTMDEIAARLMPSDDNDIEAFKTLLKNLPVLAIDEPDKIEWTQWNVRHIGEVLDHRHRNGASHVTLFSMNRQPAE